MNTRMYVLGGVLGLLTLVYGWFVLLPSSGTTEVMPVERPTRPLSFILNRDVLIDGVKVVVYEPGPAGQPDQAYERTVWQLEVDPDKSDERREEDSVMYGRRLRGMRVPEGLNARPEPLQRGAKYRFELLTDSGEAISVDFQPRFGQG